MTTTITPAISDRSNVILIGFMGAGKTSAGRRASEISGMPLVETDLEIERLAKEKIADIFLKRGEHYFRELEEKVCAGLVKNENAIISTGGGILTREKNEELIKRAGNVIYLAADAPHIYKNIKSDAKRPVLANTQGAERLLLIKRLLKEREPSYIKCADFVISVADKTIEEIAFEILTYRGK